MMYIARTLDAFISIRALVLKSILSKFVDSNELGRSFSIIAIIEAFGKFVFVSLYSVIYENTLDTWPSAFYFFSFIFLVLTALLFVYVYSFFFYFYQLLHFFQTHIFFSILLHSLLYFIVKRKEKRDEAEKLRLEEAASKQPDLGETTHM